MIFKIKLIKWNKSVKQNIKKNNWKNNKINLFYVLIKLKFFKKRIKNEYNFTNIKFNSFKILNLKFFINLC